MEVTYFAFKCVRYIKASRGLS